MKRNLIVTNYKNGVAVALFSDLRPVELVFEERESRSLLGNIYVGKVSNIVKNIDAAFVEIEDRVACYYSMRENTRPVYVSKKKSDRLCVGDEILVQVSREGVKTKAPTVTANLSLSGKYLVLTVGKCRISASAKLDVSKRTELLKIAEAFADERFGWIVRTNAADAGREELIREAENLSACYERLVGIAPHRPCRSCLYRNPAPWLLRIRDIYDSEYERILTDDRELYEQLSGYLADAMPSHLPRLALYQDRLLPLAKLYALDRAFEEASRERVWLKSGAYLVIQATEALTAIDVNTGKCERGKAEDTFFRINLEAAHEIARQLRLRNLSGIILIDFINMELEEQRQSLMRALDDDLAQDPVKACVVDMTKLGLVEVTRKRVQKSLAERTRGMEFAPASP